MNKADEWWKDKTSEEYSKKYKKYDNLKFIISEPILEIGGGAGTFLKYIGIKKATIVDIGGKNSLVGNYKFIKADITKKLPDIGKFKTIFIMETLEHIKNPLYLMAQVYDLLEDGGICYIGIPYTKLYLKWNSDNPYNIHYSRWKLKEIKDQMQKLGFKVKVIQKHRRFKNTAFYLPHCWLVLELKKGLNNQKNFI